MRSGIAEKGNFISRHSKLSIILVYNLGTLLGMAIFYRLIPILMGYPEGMVELTGKIAVSYDLQYAVFGLFSVIIGTIFLLFLLRGVGRWQKAVDENDSVNLEKIRKKCINLPYTIFILQIIIVGVSVPAVIGIVCFLNSTPLSQFLKISTVVFSLFSLIAVFSHIFSKSIFMKILIKTYKGEGLQGRRIGIRNKIFLQIIPMFMVAILFTSVLAFSRLIEEKGMVTYKLCKLQLNQTVTYKRDYKSNLEILDDLKNIKIDGVKVGYFTVKKADGAITTSDGYVPGVYFKYYAQNTVEGDRVYGDSNDMQGVVANVKINGEDYFAGVRFENASDKTINFFLIAFFGLPALNIFVLYYFSKTLTSEINLVVEGLTEIAEGEHVDLDKKLAVISNDELGDLVVAFNRVQEREKLHIKKMQKNEKKMAEQNRLSALGQLIGGISHNLKTPIMSLAGAIEGLKDLTKEFRESVEDDTVTKEDYIEIAKEMEVWLEKMKPYCAYMNDIISTVKEQTVRPKFEEGVSFTVEELEVRTKILFEHELRKRNCKMSIECSIPKDTKIMGEVSDIVQVINNLILNAAQSYEGEAGDIVLKIDRKDNELIVSVTDYGKGISEDVQEKLFKEMVTTKGKKGTGLGLYMSHTNIKARFGGEMWFESKEGKGTTVYISIPMNKA